jgi:hypothetical protein
MLFTDKSRGWPYRSHWHHRREGGTVRHYVDSIRAYVILMLFQRVNCQFSFAPLVLAAVSNAAVQGAANVEPTHARGEQYHVSRRYPRDSVSKEQNEEFMVSSAVFVILIEFISAHENAI